MKLKDRAVVEGIIVPAMIAAINGAVWEFGTASWRLTR